jgi:hypothetical protein
MLDSLDVAWFAGLFEGDGSFGYGGVEKQRLYLGVQLTDLDVLMRIEKNIGGKVTGPYFKATGHNVKPMYSWGLNVQSEVWSLVDKIYPFLGARRRQVVDAALIRKENFVDKRFKVSA